MRFRAQVRKRVTRRKWGAVKARCRTLVNPFGLRGICVHYSGTLSDYRPNHAECDDVVRSFQRFHMAPGGLGVPQGGCDIAYNHLICPHGHTFVGRGFRNQSGANGTSDSNRKYHSVCMLGGDKVGRKDITPEAQESLRHYRQRFVTLFPHARRVAWHSLFASSGCPGDELRAMIRRMFPKNAGA